MMIRDWLRCLRPRCAGGTTVGADERKRRYAIVADQQAHARARLADLARAIEIQRAVRREGRDGRHGKPA